MRLRAALRSLARECWAPKLASGWRFKCGEGTDEQEPQQQ